MHDSAGIILGASSLSLLFGLVILMVCMRALRKKRLQVMSVSQAMATQSGATQSGNDFFYYINPNSRNRLPGGIGIVADLHCEFRCEPLDNFDKLATILGFARPVQTGDPAFDSQIYTYSSNPSLYQLLSGNAALRQAILAVMSAGFSALVAVNGKLLAFGGQGGVRMGNKNSDPQVAHDLAAKLHDCRKYLSAVQADPNDQSLKRAAVFDKKIRLFFRIGLFAGIFAAVLVAAAPNQQLLSVIPLFRLAGLAAVPLMVALLLVLRVFTSDTPYGADAFKAFIQMGIITVASWTFAGLYYVNMHWDTQNDQQHWQRVMSKHYTTGRHNSHTYHVLVEGWKNDGNVDLIVSLPVYSSITAGQMMRVLSHPGYFNIEWVSL